MHALHARLGKNFDLAQRLIRYQKAIVEKPKTLRGSWCSWCCPCEQNEHGKFVQAAFEEVRLDLGCGKGNFTLEAARREPGVLFVGVDIEPMCIAIAAQKICDEKLSNVVVFCAHSSLLHEYFAQGELARIYLNFPTPFPRKKQARDRLVYLDNLLVYRDLLAKGAKLTFKTDSYPLMQFAKTQFVRAGYTCTWESDNARADRPDEPISQYEEKLSEQGARVLAREYIVGALPAQISQVEKLSLVDYLPRDLSLMSYIPHGMQGTFTNLINYEAKHNGKRLDSHGQPLQ